jgi:hypothetical protein
MREALWELLRTGARDRRHAFHTPMLATADAAGRPEVRTVVLREVEPDAWRLRFNTDGRSPKVVQMAANPQVALAFYDAAARVQVRVEGIATIHAADARADAAWAAAQMMSRVCYGTSRAPGSVISTADDYTLPSGPDEIAGGRANFRTVLVAATRVELLNLAASRHRRADFIRQPDGSVIGNWLAP